MGTLLVEAVGFGIVVGAIVGIGAMGFSVQFGLTNVFNLSFGGVMTVAAFSLLWIEGWGLNPWLALPMGAVIGIGLTLAIGKLVFPYYARRGATRIFEMAIISVALLLIMEYGTEAVSKDNIYSIAFNEGRNFTVGGMIFNSAGLIILGLLVIILVLLEALLHGTRLGKALRAMAVEPRLARSCGIPTHHIVNITWIISGALAGLAGVVYALNISTVDYSVADSIWPLIFAAALLGRAGSPLLSCAAAFTIGITSEVVSALGGSAYGNVAGVGILILVLLSKPKALASEVTMKREVTV